MDSPPKSFGKRKWIPTKEEEKVAPPMPVFGGFERYTKQVGMKIMEKQGYQLGTGLGVHNQGRILPLKGVPRKDEKAGFGYKGDLGTGIIDDVDLPIHARIWKNLWKK